MRNGQAERWRVEAYRTPDGESLMRTFLQGRTERERAEPPRSSSWSRNGGTRSVSRIRSPSSPVYGIDREEAGQDTCA